MSLVDRLTGLTADDQGALARREAETASSSELIDALKLDGLGEWAQLHIADELTRRGSSLVGEVGRALLAEPLGPGAPSLREVLVDIAREDPAAQDDVVNALLDAGNAALDAGGGSQDAGWFVAHLAGYALVGDPHRRAAELARRLLDAAATEARPFPLTVAAAKRLANQKS